MLPGPGTTYSENPVPGWVGALPGISSGLFIELRLIIRRERLPLRSLRNKPVQRLTALVRVRAPLLSNPHLRQGFYLMGTHRPDASSN